MIRFSLQNTVTNSDVLVIPLFQDISLEKQLSEAPGLHNQNLGFVFETEDFEGKAGQMTWVYTGETEIPRVLLVGLGEKEKCTLRKWKHVVGAAVVASQAKKTKSVTVLLFQALLEKFEVEMTVRETTLAAEVAAYAYDEYKQKDAQVTPLEECVLVFKELKSHLKSAQKGVEAGVHIAQSINWVREMGNTPPSVMTPSVLANEAKKISKINPVAKVKVLSRTEIEKLKMGCFLGVASGSEHEPKFIIVEYLAGKKTEKPTVLVGKGITFDSGGLSLKPGDYMVDMKFDMLGAATVLGIIRACAALGVKRNIVGLIPSCENMPSGKAYRPDDILIAMNGKSVLVENTDAEGRLILADALCYASRYNPKEVIDFATLTGACLVALGNERSGLFSQDEKIVSGLMESSSQVGEQLWRLPLGEEYTDAIKSEVADVKNLGGVGGPRFAGASTGAAFLEYFTDYPWAHIDLSCSYYGGKGKSYIRHGANGFGVETLVEYLKG